MEKSLAQFVSEKREAMGLNRLGLAHRCNLSVSEIDEIEMGMMLFLPTTIRQKLARGLKVELVELKKYEKGNKAIGHEGNKGGLLDDVPNEIIEDIKERILNGEKEIVCPKCGCPLVVRVAKMYDLEDNLMLHPKARCTKCTFQIKD